MQNIKEFMHGLFSARIAEEKQILASRVLYREKYFTNDCLWDSREGTLEMIETETVSTVDEGDFEGTVITTFSSSFLKSDQQLQRRKYHLKRSGDGWRISLVEHQCPACRGQGDINCRYCRGKHWK